MYAMNNRMPAPYELNQQQQFMGQPQALARGGRARNRSRMVLAHMNPNELNILDHLQGNSSRDHKTGIRTYSHLEELLKNPHLVRNVHHHARAHHSNGGSAEMEHLRAGGRHGDSELALIGDHTHHLFNQLAGHTTRNPNTGHPEYFSIGGALNGLWNTVKGVGQAIIPGLKGVAQAAAPALMPMAQQALGDRFGAAGQMAGNMLGAGANHFLGPKEGDAPANPYHEAIGRGLGRSVESYRSGASPYQAFGQGMQTAGSNLGGGFGSAMQSTGESMGRGRGLRESLGAGARSGYNQMGGMEGLSNMASNVGQAYGRGGLGAARQSARDEMSGYARNAFQPAQRSLPAPHMTQAPQQQQMQREEPREEYRSEGFSPEMYGGDEYQEAYNQ